MKLRKSGANFSRKKECPSSEESKFDNDDLVGEDVNSGDSYESGDSGSEHNDDIVSEEDLDDDVDEAEGAEEEEEEENCDGREGDVNKDNRISLKRKQVGEENGDSNKKQKVKSRDANLYRPPTVKELNQLRETENLFHSNLFRMQIQEMLKEVTIKTKYSTLFLKWLEEFKNFLVSLPKTKKLDDVMDKKWLKKLGVQKIPLRPLPLVTGGFHFEAPSSVSLAGSYQVGCCLGPNVKIDVKVEIPEGCLDVKDYLNHQYHRKRAMYLGHIAFKLKSSEFVEEMQYFQCCGDPMKPVLQIKPAGKLGKHVLVVLHLTAPSGIFKLARFSPEKNNVRPNWFFSENEKVEESSLTPTPHYSSSILQDLVMVANEEYRTSVLNSHPNLKDGILLLKVWLRQRGLDQGYGCFSGFIMSMYVLYLLQCRRVNSAMSSYQVARNTWSNLAQSNWTTEAISLAQPEVPDLHQYFEVVFVDVTGHHNYCAHMSKETFFWVKRESELAVKCLDNPNINSFQALFMTPMPFYRQFDHIIRLHDLSMLADLVQEKSSRAQKLDYLGHVYPQALSLVLSILRRGLGSRVCNFGIQLPAVQHWPINECPPSPVEFVTLGITLNPEFAFSVLEKGPGANLPEAFEFREFWGKKSEVRRFQDGSISEAVVWHSGPATLAQKRLICKQIVTYLLSEKLDIPVDDGVVYLADQLDTLLEQHTVQPAEFDYGTGEEAAARVIGALDSLGKQLRQLKDLPLEVSGLQGTSPVFRYSEVFPPLATTRRVPKQQLLDGRSFLLMMQSPTAVVPRWVPPVEAVIQLSMSGKWPSDIHAVQRIKAAFYIKIADSLEKQFQLTAQPYPDCVRILKDGFVFQLKVAHQREIVLLKETVTPEGVTKYRDTEESLALEKSIIHLPKLTSALHGLHQQFPSYGPTCCLAKRWLSAQLLDPHHFPEVCTELLVASIYLMPEPFSPPNQPQLGFFQFLHLLANINWNTEPVILNLNGEMNRDEILEIETWFRSSRSTLPALFLSTPYDKKNSVWTKEAPTLQILMRVAALAEEALRVIEGLLFSPVASDWKQIFRPPLEIYDVVIHLLPRVNPRRYEAVDVRYEKSKYQLPAYKQEPGEKVPLTGFNPIYCFLAELRENYGDYALFFYDIYGGDVITVLWNPSVLLPRDFKVSHVNCHKPSQEDSKIKLNVDAIVEDFHILGTGIIASIDVKSS